MASKKPSRNARHLLSVREVQHAADGDHRDGGNLYLRIRGPSGAWVFRYTASGGKRREMGLGPVERTDPAITGDSLTKAREAAHEARKLLDAGKDPIDSRKAAEEAKRQVTVDKKQKVKAAALTLARHARKYHEDFIEGELTEKHSAQWISSLENHVPPELWHRPIASIQADELLDLMKSLKAKIPETAGRIRQRLDTIFDDALFRKLVTHNPAAAIRARLKPKGKKNRRVVTHFKALPYSRVPAFMRQLKAAAGTGATAFRFLILTAARTSEVLLASWDEVDMTSGVWTIPGERMKSGEPHLVFLSAPALKILETQKADPLRHSRWIFLSPIGNEKPLSNMAFLALLRRFKLDDVATGHGFRSSFSTWAAEGGRHRSEAIEACLAHRETDLVKAAYSRAQFVAERRNLLDDWARFCTGDEAIELKDAA